MIAEFQTEVENASRDPRVSKTDYFYVFEFRTEINWDTPIIKVGETSDFLARIKHHRTSWPGWTLKLMAQSDCAVEVQNFWKRYFSPWKWRGSPEVFTPPAEHFSFLETVPIKFYDQMAVRIDAEWLRDLPFAQRVAALICCESFDYKEAEEPLAAFIQAATRPAPAYFVCKNPRRI